MTVLSRFRSKYANLKKPGLEIEDIANVDYDKGIDVISVSHPFIFDHRLLPKEFEGVPVKAGVRGELPEEFQIDERNPDSEYIWAPERFEKFVDKAMDEIRTQLGNAEMPRQKILDALCFGDFPAHKKRVELAIKEGRIPRYREKGPGNETDQTKHRSIDGACRQRWF